MAHIIGDVKTDGAAHESSIHYSDETFSDGVAFPSFKSFNYIADHHDEVVVYDDLLPEAPTNAFLAIATSRTHSLSPLRVVFVP
jgi:hypothetical protein